MPSIEARSGGGVSSTSSLSSAGTSKIPVLHPEANQTKAASRYKVTISASVFRLILREFVEECLPHPCNLIRYYLA